MTTNTREHASEMRIARAEHASPGAPSVGDFAFGLIDAVGGAGIVFMAFLAPIPGLLPALMLVGLFVALLLIPPVVFVAVACLAFVVLRLTVRVTSRAVARFFAHAASSGRRPHGAYRARIGAHPAAYR